MVVAVGMLVGGVVLTGCDLGEGEACLIDDDCTKPGETCIDDLFSNRCGCDPTAAVDSCTEADVNNVCHPDRKVCEKSCLSDKDCTSGETCDWDEVTGTGTGACRAEGAKDDCTQPGNACAAGEVCNPTTTWCEPDCRQLGNECVAGQQCDTDGICVDECGGNVCTSAQYCNDAGTACVDKCTGGIDDKCATNEECNTTTGRCVERSGCTDNVACADDGGFCNTTSGQCETWTDISECAAGDYVDYSANVCKPAIGNLDQCAPASKRSGDRPAKTSGPTIYAAEPFKLDPTGCDGTSPLIWFFADYYDKDGNASQSSFSGPYGKLRLLMTTDGLTKGNESQNYMEVCKANSTNEGCKKSGVNVASNQQEGRILFSICRNSVSQDGVIAIYLGDAAGTAETANYGNTMCIDIETQYL